ncbi:MAG: WecB/TagA/CpsF family glycosyltransferase [Verrucomicrobia bacterium]|nr:WecB/TagA/CpsF family glycosyltransferase [Verrucomicrobiota bacterium]
MPLVWLGRWEAQRWTATARLRPAGYDVARDSWRAEALAKAAGPRGAAANDPNAPGCAGGARGLARPSASRVPARAIERVYGPDLMLAVCDQGRASGLTHYFYGGAPGVAEELRSKLRARFPGLNVAGTFTPPFRPLDPGEIAALQADVARVRPDVIWVGLGTPKQERFMAQHWRELDAGVLIGVGAAFDFHSGRVRQAPRWMQRSGFEWLFRLGTEPRRLGPRYLKTNPLFALRVLAQRLGLKKYSLER